MDKNHGNLRTQDSLNKAALDNNRKKEKKLFKKGNFGGFWPYECNFLYSATNVCKCCLKFQKPFTTDFKTCAILMVNQCFSQSTFPRKQKNCHVHVCEKVWTYWCILRIKRSEEVDLCVLLTCWTAKWKLERTDHQHSIIWSVTGHSEYRRFQIFLVTRKIDERDHLNCQKQRSNKYKAIWIFY